MSDGYNIILISRIWHTIYIFFVGSLLLYGYGQMPKSVFLGYAFLLYPWLGHEIVYSYNSVCMTWLVTFIMLLLSYFCIKLILMPWAPILLFVVIIRYIFY